MKQELLVCVPIVERTYTLLLLLTHACMQAWPIQTLQITKKNSVAANSLSLSNPLPLVGTISALIPRLVYPGVKWQPGDNWGGRPSIALI